MSKEELVEFLRENLKVEISFTGGNGYSRWLELEVLLEGVVIYSTQDSIPDND